MYTMIIVHIRYIIVAHALTVIVVHSCTMIISCLTRLMFGAIQLGSSGRRSHASKAGGFAGPRAPPIVRGMIGGAVNVFWAMISSRGMFKVGLMRVIRLRVCSGGSAWLRRDFGGRSPANGWRPEIKEWQRWRHLN